MLKREEKEFLLSGWNAFLIGLISDQSVKAEIAWRLPYYLSKRLGHFDFCRIAEEETVESLETIIKEKPALHRYPRKMAEYIFFAVNKIVKEYYSDVENVWKNDLNAEQVVAKLEEFKGISHKKAALGTLLLVRDFGVALENLYCIGRNGQHRYNNMDHSMITAFRAVDCILAGSTDRTSVWNVNTEQSYQEENSPKSEAVNH